jgi:hypothetical protein
MKTFNESDILTDDGQLDVTGVQPMEGSTKKETP